MHVDTRDLEDGSILEGDLCIVGAGAAGISMALQWIGTPFKVLLLEAGGFDYDVLSQNHYQGESVGQPYFPLNAARLRQFGGTTGHWAGFCSPLDEIDFEDRNWVPNSTWPIKRAELDSYYARAQQLVELGPYEYGADFWEAQDSSINRLPLGDTFWTKMWQFSPPTQFGKKYRDAIAQAPNIHLYTHAAVCELVANEGVTALQQLEIRTVDGRKHRARARNYVMACGAIQNARILLASNRQAPGGVGNDYDQVGRYFMEHIEMPGANVIFAEPRSLKMYIAAPKIAGGEAMARGELALNANTQRTEEVLNGTASIAEGLWGENIQSTFQQFDADVLEEFRLAEERGESPVPLLEQFGPQRAFKLFTRQEQAPNPNSRVMLSDEQDSLGVPRIKLNWQLTELDKRSIRRFYELLGQEMGRTGLGRVQLADWLLDGDDKSWPSFLSGGWHHMGTAKMHSDPHHGVVDADCRVHGIDNLYVAGSATFSTSGAPNPTLTLIALALRLSDHLIRKKAKAIQPDTSP